METVEHGYRGGSRVGRQSFRRGYSRHCWRQTALFHGEIITVEAKCYVPPASGSQMFARFDRIHFTRHFIDALTDAEDSRPHPARISNATDIDGELGVFVA